MLLSLGCLVTRHHCFCSEFCVYMLENRISSQSRHGIAIYSKAPIKHPNINRIFCHPVAIKNQPRSLFLLRRKKEAPHIFSFGFQGLTFRTIGSFSKPSPSPPSSPHRSQKHGPTVAPGGLTF